MEATANFMDRTGEFFGNLGDYFSNFFSDVRVFIGESAEKMRESLRNFWEKLGEFCKNGLDHIKNGLSAIGNGFVQLGEKLKEIGGVVFDKVKDIASSIGEKTKEFAGFIADKFSQAWDWAKETFANIGEKTAESFSNAFERSKEFFKNFGNKISEFCGVIGNKISDFSKNCVSAIKNFAQNMREKFSECAPKIKEAFANAKVKIAAGVAVIGTGIKKLSEKFKTTLSGVKEKISNKFAQLKERAEEKNQARMIAKSETGEKAVAKKKEKEADLAKKKETAAKKKKVKEEEKTVAKAKAEESKKVKEKAKAVDKAETLNGGEKETKQAKGLDENLIDEDTQDMLDLWEAMKLDLSRGKFKNSFDKVMSVEKFVANMDEIIYNNIPVFEDAILFDSIEEILTYASVKNPQYKETVLNVYEEIDKCVVGLRENQIDQNDKNKICEFFDKYKEFTRIDYGFDIDNVLNERKLENEKNQPNKEETEILKSVGLVDPVVGVVTKNEEEKEDHKESIEDLSAKDEFNVDLGENKSTDDGFYLGEDLNTVPSVMITPENGKIFEPVNEPFETELEQGDYRVGFAIIIVGVAGIDNYGKSILPMVAEIENHGARAL